MGEGRSVDAAHVDQRLQSAALPWSPHAQRTVTVPVDCGAQEYEIGAHELLHEGQGDGGRLVHHQQIRLPQLGMVLWLHVLYSLHALRCVSIRRRRCCD